MSWSLARLAVGCGFCPQTIPVDDPVRFGDRTPVAWCAACAKRLLGEDVPPMLSAAPAAAAEPEPEPESDFLPLFGEPSDRRFKHAEAREALEGLRRVISQEPRP